MLKRQHLTTAELVELKRQRGRPFAVNPDNLIRIKPDQVRCPTCQGPMALDRVVATPAAESQSTHRAACHRCDLVITLWNRWLDDHFIL